MQSEFISSDSPAPFRSEISEISEAQTFPPETGSSRAVSPARIFPSLVKALGWRVADQDFGTSMPASLASYDRDTRLWKTSERLLFEDSTPCLDRLPKSGMMRSGKIYAPPMSERPTVGKESGLLPTPRSAEAEHSGRKAMNHGGQTGLAEAVNNWPTPRTSDADRGGRGDLIQAVRGNQNKHYATPTSRDWRSGKASKATMERNSRPLSEQVGGQLNPTWVEWLMGYPLGWTDLNVSGIALFLKSRK